MEFLEEEIPEEYAVGVSGGGNFRRISWRNLLRYSNKITWGIYIVIAKITKIIPEKLSGSIARRNPRKNSENVFSCFKRNQ